MLRERCHVPEEDSELHTTNKTLELADLSGVLQFNSGRQHCWPCLVHPLLSARVSMMSIQI
jgi:hypothetical protein